MMFVHMLLSKRLSGLQVLGLVMCLLYPVQPLMGQQTYTKPSKTYRHVMNALPSSLDPLHAGVITATRMIHSVYDSLYEYKYLARPYTLKPNLAASMPYISPDGLTVEVPLKRGVYFIDDPCFPLGKGREVTADDFVYSLLRHFDPKHHSNARWLMQDYLVGAKTWDGQAVWPTIGLRAKDRYTIEFRLTKPIPFFAHLLGRSFAVIIPKEAPEFYGVGFAKHPVGTGPWVLKSMTPVRIVLDRNPSYRVEIFDVYEHGYDESLHGFTGILASHKKQLPLVDQVEVTEQTEEFIQWEAFLTDKGSHQVVLPSQQAIGVLASRDPLVLSAAYGKNYKAMALPNTKVSYHEFHMQSRAFGQDKDPKENQRKKALRCAMKKAFHWEDYLNKFSHGLGHSYHGIVPHHIQGFSEALVRPRMDYLLALAEGKKLLQAYGWHGANVPVFHYATVATVRSKQAFEAYRHALIQLGYPKDKIIYQGFASFNDYIQAAREGRLDFHAELLWSYDYPDAQNGMQVFYGPFRAPGANLSNYQNPHYDRIFEQISTMQPGSLRESLIVEAMNLLTEDCVALAFVVLTDVHVWKKQAILYPTSGMLTNPFKYINLE